MSLSPPSQAWRHSAVANIADQMMAKVTWAGDIRRLDECTSTYLRSNASQCRLINTSSATTTTRTNDAGHDLRQRRDVITTSSRSKPAVKQHRNRRCRLVTNVVAASQRLGHRLTCLRSSLYTLSERCLELLGDIVMEYDQRGERWSREFRSAVCARCTVFRQRLSAPASNSGRPAIGRRKRQVQWATSAVTRPSREPTGLPLHLPLSARREIVVVRVLRFRRAISYTFPTLDSGQSFFFRFLALEKVVEFGNEPAEARAGTRRKTSL